MSSSSGMLPAVVRQSIWRPAELLWLGRSLTAQAVRLLAAWLYQLADRLEGGGSSKQQPPPPPAAIDEDLSAGLNTTTFDMAVAVAKEAGEVVPHNLATAKKPRCNTWQSTDSGIDLGHMAIDEENNEEEEEAEEMDAETGLRIVSLEAVGDHCQPEDAWTVVYDRVYDVTEYLGRHPGGEEVMLEYVGYDATMAFRGVGHSPAAMRTLNKFLIGILPKHERLGFSAD
jgi:cytochrome b involved in lipid metabolism